VSFNGGSRRLALLRSRGAVLRARVAHGRRSGPELAATDTITVAGVLAVLVTGAGLVAGGSPTARSASRSSSTHRSVRWG
jgi:hypothetical protein